MGANFVDQQLHGGSAMITRCPYCKESEGVEPISEPQNSTLENGEACIYQAFQHVGCKSDSWNKTFGEGVPKWTYRVDNIEEY